MTEQIQAGQLEQVASEIGELFQSWGFKRIHGRIWTYLYLSAGALDAPTLIGLLKVSKALISISLEQMTKFELIRFDGLSERRTKIYTTNEDSLKAIAEILSDRAKRFFEAAGDSLARLENGKEFSSHSLVVSSDRCAKLCNRLNKYQQLVSKFAED